MNQCRVYKAEIREHKRTIDRLEMNFSSLRNITKNLLEAYSDEDDAEDDFRDNLVLLAKVAGLNEKEKTRLNWYMQRYRQTRSQ